MKLKSGKYQVFSTKSTPSANREPQNNLMKIRICDPIYTKWYPIKKRGKSYYIEAEAETEKLRKSQQRFVTLDVGDLDEPKIQGIAYIRGIPKTHKLDIGFQIPNLRKVPIKERINQRFWKTQAIRIVYKDIGLSSSDPPSVKISTALTKYKTEIIKFLQIEYFNQITDVSIKEKKGGDFELIISLSPNPEMLKLNLITIQEIKEGSKEDKLFGLSEYLNRLLEERERIIDDINYFNKIEANKEAKQLFTKRLNIINKEISEIEIEIRKLEEELSEEEKFIEQQIAETEQEF